jgi:Zn-dependent protease
MRTISYTRRLWQSFTLFRVFGVPVQCHTTWLVFPCGFLVVGGYLCDGRKGILIGLVFLMLLVGSILVHEFAHILVARAYGCSTRRVLLIPFACIADLKAIPLGPPEIWMAAAGPLANLLLSGLAWLAFLATHNPPGLAAWWFHKLLGQASWLNLYLAGFNLSPCFPMDGGRILRSGLSVLIESFFPTCCRNPILLATRIAVRYVARAIILGIFVLTVFRTHLWHHLLIFGIVGLAGEAEFWMLREAVAGLGETNGPRFLPVALPEEVMPREEPALPLASCLSVNPVGQVSGGLHAYQSRFEEINPGVHKSDIF